MGDALADLISRAAVAIRSGDVDGAAALVAAHEGSGARSVPETLLRAAVAPTPAAAIENLAAGLEQVPGDARLMAVLGSANGWISGRIDRAAFALSCLEQLGSQAAGAAATGPQPEPAPPPGGALEPEHLPTPEDEAEADPAAAAHAAADLALAAGDRPAAIAALQRGIERAGARSALLERLATLLVAQGRTGEAISVLAQLARLEPERADVLANLGLLQAEAGLARAARENLERALALDPALDAVAIALAAVGGTPPRAPTALMDLATARGLAERGDSAAARQVYASLVDNPDAGYAAVLGLARLGLHLEDGQAAYEAFQTLAQRWPEDPQGYVGAAKALAMMGRAREARIAALLALDHQPNDLAARELVAALGGGDGYEFLRLRDDET